MTLSYFQVAGDVAGSRILGLGSSGGWGISVAGSRGLHKRAVMGVPTWWVATAGIFAVVLAIVGFAPSAQAATTYKISYSTSADRSAPLALDGATVSGDLYAFTNPYNSVGNVVFALDDPTLSGTTHTDMYYPYDFNGGSSAAATPFDTRTLSDGAHTITEKVTTSTNVVSTFTATFTVINAPAPPKPTGIKATGGDGYVDVSWGAATGSTVGFNVYRGTTSAVSTSGAALNGTVLSTGTSFHDGTVTNGTTYYYLVQSVDSDGHVAQSAVVNTTPAARRTGRLAVLPSGERHG